MKKVTEIYNLELEQGIHYVGKTSLFDRRFKQHLFGNGSAWTNRCMPLKVLLALQHMMKTKVILQ